MLPKCLICSKDIFKSTGPKEKLYCSKECSSKARWIRESSSYEHVLSKILKGAKYRAVSKNLPFDLDYNFVVSLWVEQDGKCALTGFKFDLGPSTVKNTAKRNAPSLDRIVPDLGYVRGNVRIITYQANCAKSGYTDQDLIEMCKAIIKGAA